MALAGAKPMGGGVRRKRLQIKIVIAEIDGQTSRVVSAGRVVRNDRTIRGDECLESGQIRIAALFIIDLHTDVKLFGHIRGVDSKRRRIGGQRFVPILHEADSADGKHHANTLALKIIYNRSVHANGDSIHGGGVGGGIHEVNGIDEAQDDQVDRGLAGTAIEEPVIVGVEGSHIRDGEPAAAVGVAVPDAIDLHLGLGANTCNTPSQRINGSERGQARSDALNRFNGADTATLPRACQQEFCENQSLLAWRND